MATSDNGYSAAPHSNGNSSHRNGSAPPISPVRTPWVHFGVGHFFRGHGAVLAQRLGVEVTGVNLHDSHHVRETLAAQGNAYNIVTPHSDGGFDIERVHSIRSVMVAAEDPLAVVDVLADPATKLVTLTVTQTAYPTGGLESNPEVSECLRRPDAPSSIVGLLAAGLAKRYAAGGEPFVVMSLDNFVGNGDILRRATVAYAERRGRPDLARWIETEVVFPNTMVDRIVPTTSAAMKRWLHRNAPAVAASDQWPVFAEPWPKYSLVIGDHAANPLLGEFQKVGAALVPDVYPYSAMKVGMLNGLHLTLGMIGRLAGNSFAHEAIANPVVREVCQGILDEIVGTLNPMAGVDYRAYAKETMGRVANPFLADELARLARNGTDKVQQRIVDPLQRAIAHGEPHDHLMIGLAAWAHYLRAARDGKLDIADTGAQKRGLLGLRRQAYTNAAEFAQHIPGLARGLRNDPRFQAELQASLDTFPGLLTRAMTAPRVGPSSRSAPAPLGVS
ncbi:MAG: hypothetical protein ACR2GX_05345 [Candidatus Dormibacteria bacterium]